MKILLSCLILFLTPSSWAISETEMVKELKSFIVKVEHESTFHDIISFQRPYSFFTEAWASQLNCFYGGWPCSLVKQGQRQYCSNPMLGSPLYPKSGCAEGEMSCQPQTPTMSDEEFNLIDRWENAKSLSEKAALVWEFRTMNVRPFIDATYGCLGVARHPNIDRATGKTVDQLDYLRSKINNGSLIYSHATEEQTSDYY